TVNAVGSIDAFEKVQVTARVSGVVDRVLFAEGNTVAVDQVLVEIEPERYRLAVEAAQASYEKALASKADAEAGLKRRETVINQTPGLIPGEELETWRTKVLLAMSDVALTLAALNQAKLNLHDAYVRAPFSGILQTRTVQTGQYVQVGTVMATLVRRDPLLLRFRVPERDASQLRPGMPANFKMRDDAREFSSKIVHVADAADEVSRMVPITAEIIDSRDPVLRPGAFAEITIPVSTARSSPVIPQIAIRPSERGFIAYVVENDAAVERVLTLGMRTADGQAEVLSGLKAGEILVIRGAEALRNGVPVKSGPSQAPGAKPAEKKPKGR
ncbi:MAG: efflux RND transporter periplasmic adaptor subunit, partial [Candidatus Aminicenantes bacterium]|nr:efflux RND transporter periplasmic adaptor subunit [Candidatus Aminicenantes bacterium]